MSAAKHTPGPWEVRIEFAIPCIRPANPYAQGYSSGYAPIAKVTGDRRIGGQLENARLIAAAPELLAELQAAHQIIKNALNLMTPEQKNAWAAKNEADGVIGEGDTRANERLTVINKATGEPQ